MQKDTNTCWPFQALWICSRCVSILARGFSRILLFKGERHCHLITYKYRSSSVFLDHSQLSKCLVFLSLLFCAIFFPLSKCHTALDLCNTHHSCRQWFYFCLFFYRPLVWVFFFFVCESVLFPCEDYQPSFFTWEENLTFSVSCFQMRSDGRSKRSVRSLCCSQHGTSRYL